MRFVYLEAGSGSKQSVRPDMVRAVRKIFKGFLIVGGGIRDANTAKEIVKAGADALVIGTLLERENDSLKKLTEIANSIKSIRK
jgi:phosphoglycerol geranylgeranyltransferase